jgi:hypothetical protein
MRVRSHARGPGAAACAELRSAVAHRRSVADRTHLVDDTGEMGDSRVPAHKRTAGVHSRAVGDRSFEVGRSQVATHKRGAVAHNRAVADRSFEVGRSQVATHKRAAVAHNGAVADRTRAARRSQAATHKHTATAHNQVAARSHPGLRHDEEMRPWRAALRRRQSQCKDGA